MRDTFSTAQASALTGVSAQAIRVYTNVYKRYFSTEAAPLPGVSKRFRPDDLKVIAFIYYLSEQQACTREQVAERLAAGELDTFEWMPPESATAAPAAPQEQSTALVPIERLQATQALLQDAQRRESEAAEQVAALQSEVQRLAGELGAAKGELAGFRSAQYRSPKWWRSIFGGRQE